MHKEFFFKNFEVQYYEIDQHQKATPLTLLNYLEETAISHSASVGYDVDTLKSLGFGWILNRWYIQMNRYPKLHEKIKVETWPSSFERFYATREFNVKDASGQLIGKATTRWIFIHTEKKRPLRIPTELGNAYGVEPAKALDEPFRDLSFHGTAEQQSEFTVRRSDIDTNHHVNNASYVEWLLEGIPQEVYNGSSLCSLEVEYKKETTYGTTVGSETSCCGTESSETAFIHRILDKDTGTELAVARTVWRREG